MKDLSPRWFVHTLTDTTSRLHLITVSVLLLSSTGWRLISDYFLSSSKCLNFFTLTESTVNVIVSYQRICMQEITSRSFSWRKKNTFSHSLYSLLMQSFISLLTEYIELNLVRPFCFKSSKWTRFDILAFSCKTLLCLNRSIVHWKYETLAVTIWQLMNLLILSDWAEIDLPGYRNPGNNRSFCGIQINFTICYWHTNIHTLTHANMLWLLVQVHVWVYASTHGYKIYSLTGPNLALPLSCICPYSSCHK